MPIHACISNQKPGYRWGNTNKCWTYTKGDEASRKKAKQNCIRQAYAFDREAVKTELSKNSAFEIQEEGDDELMRNWPDSIEDFKELVKLKELHEVETAQEHCRCNRQV